MKSLGIAALVLVGWIGLMFVVGLYETVKVPVDLPPMSVNGGADYAFASGTWTIEGDKLAFPFQTTRIECRRDAGTCDSATAEIGMGSQLYLNTQTFRITSWTDDSIVFVDEAPSCVNYIHTINPRIKSVSAIRKILPPEKQTGECSGLDDELRLTMKSGFDITKQMREENETWFSMLVFAPLQLFIKVLSWFD